MADWAPRIVVDFDGVLHSYTSGWQGADAIPDPPTPGAQEFMASMLAAGWDVVIQSTRAATVQGANAIAEWLIRHRFPAPRRDSIGDPRAAWTITAEKLPALVYLDDRALRFDGAWPTLPEVEAAGIPWNKPRG